MNFSCCTSCANYELFLALENNRKKGGYVYWHAQNEDTFKRSAFVHLGFGSRYQSPEKNKEVGRIIAEVLKDMDIPYEWNGDHTQKITVGRFI